MQRKGNAGVLLQSLGTIRIFVKSKESEPKLAESSTFR